LRKKYLAYALFLCNVEHLKDNISSIETNIPTDFSVGRDSSMVTDDTENSQVPLGGMNKKLIVKK